MKAQKKPYIGSCPFKRRLHEVCLLDMLVFVASLYVHIRNHQNAGEDVLLASLEFLASQELKCCVRQ